MIRAATDANQYSNIGFNYSGATGEPYCTIGVQQTNWTASTYADLVFATRNVTTDTAPTERMRISSAGLATFANGIACSGGGVTTSANFGQIKTSTSTAITSGSTIPISSSNANGSLVTVYEGSSGKVIVFLVSFANVVIISDPGSYGSVTDVSDKFCMLGGGSHTCILKNGFSGDKTVQIMAMGCGLE
jgi:hypothetical protein